MNCRDFILSQDGAHSCRIVLPCFEADKPSEKPEFACRMNRFYSAAADAAYRYAQTLFDGTERRIGYFCSYEVRETEEATEVLLRFTLRRTGQAASRRELLHRWKDGVLLSR